MKVKDEDGQEVEVFEGTPDDLPVQKNGVQDDA